VKQFEISKLKKEIALMVEEYESFRKISE